jgi:formylglycine-generating enzyme required for sulfatase activity
MTTFPRILAALLCSAAASHALISIDFVTVGNPGNPNDPSDGDSNTAGIQNYGAVGSIYQIGTYEVTLLQYTAFLNAVAATDPYNLYNTSMATNVQSMGISRAGGPGNYTYAVIDDGNRPVTWVSWFDAARFVNWLHNGQPTGTEGAGTTETGAYSNARSS